MKRLSHGIRSLKIFPKCRRSLNISRSRPFLSNGKRSCHTLNPTYEPYYLKMEEALVQGKATTAIDIHDTMVSNGLVPDIRMKINLCYALRRLPPKDAAERVLEIIKSGPYHNTILCNLMLEILLRGQCYIEAKTLLNTMVEQKIPFSSETFEYPYKHNIHLGSIAHAGRTLKDARTQRVETYYILDGPQMDPLLTDKYANVRYSILNYAFKYTPALTMGMVESAVKILAKYGFMNYIDPIQERANYWFKDTRSLYNLKLRGYIDLKNYGEALTLYHWLRDNPDKWSQRDKTMEHLLVMYGRLGKKEKVLSTIEEMKSLSIPWTENSVRGLLQAAILIQELQEYLEKNKKDYWIHRTNYEQWIQYYESRGDIEKMEWVISNYKQPNYNSLRSIEYESM